MVAKVGRDFKAWVNLLDYFLNVDVGSVDKRKLSVTFCDNFHEVSFDRKEKEMTHVDFEDNDGVGE